MTLGRWMDACELQEFFDAGLSYARIAERNWTVKGWRPTVPAVQRKLQRLGMPRRKLSHRALIPWRLRPEHSSSLYRRMLEAESRRRQLGEAALSDSDKSLLRMLSDRLHGGLAVVAYDRAAGFYLTPRQPYDRDIIRDPHADIYTAGALPEKWTA